MYIYALTEAGMVINLYAHCEANYRFKILSVNLLKSYN